jgi:sugar-phosphatase
VPRLLSCRALLFDLDGTLIDSLAAVDRAWTKFSLRHGLDPAEVMTQIHGKRSIDSIRRLLPNVDAQAEDSYLRYLESSDTSGVQALPGAVELLSSLPADKWAVVTSGTRDVATARLTAGGLPRPAVYVFGDDVTNGKPAPDPFLLGASRLGVEPSECIGFEDTVAGVQSIESAGMQSIGINVRASVSISDLREVRVQTDEDRLLVHLP